MIDAQHLSRESTGTGHPRWVIARLIGFRAARQGALWGAIFGTVVVTSVSGFVTTFPTAVDRARNAASLSTNPGLAAIFGTPLHLESVAGWTAWRAGGLATLIGAIWALLIATRFLRGEEDAGRWELLLTGQTTPRYAAAQAVFGLGVGLGAMFATTAAIVVVEGQRSDAGFAVTASLFFALTLVSSAAMFLAVGALASQLAATRRRAATLAAGVFGASFVVRMAADAGSGFRWARWISPLAWPDELHALSGSQLAPLGLIFGLVTALVGTTLLLAGRRDLGGSVLPGDDTAPAHTRLLGGPTGLAIRLDRGSALGWFVAISAVGLVFGLVAKAAATSVGNSERIRQALARLGGSGTGAETYLGITFLLVAMLLALLAAAQVGATREEEAEGRLDHLVVGPVTRTRWLTGRLAIAVTVIVVCAFAAGIAAWAGAAIEHTGVPFDRMLEAGANVIAPAVFVLGVGTMVHGVRPRLAGTAAYLVLAWSFLVELVGAAINASHWILDTSLLHHLAPTPAADPRWSSALVLVALGTAAAMVGIVALQRRDLANA